MASRVLDALAGAAERRGAAAVARRLARLEGAVVAEFPEIEVGRDGERLWLRAAGLASRARGRRDRAPDPRLAMLAAWLASETMGGGDVK
jgi:hypothetical protein